jgi:hypothetical protein
MKYQDEVDFIVTHQKRNDFIKYLTLSLNGNTLLLFQYVEKHGKVLYDMISKAVSDGRKVFFVYGGTDAETREQIRAITDAHKPEEKIVLTFGKNKIIVDENERIPLSNSLTKFAKHIDENDDVDDSWVISRSKK